MYAFACAPAFLLLTCAFAALRLQAHERRLRQFKALAIDAQPDESAWEVLQRGSVEKPKLSLTSETATSKRAEKKVCVPSLGVINLLI